jgi:hypothetical protein
MLRTMAVQRRYDRPQSAGSLAKALEEAQANGWTIVDMRRDWKKVFAFE